MAKEKRTSATAPDWEWYDQAVREIANKRLILGGAEYVEAVESGLKADPKNLALADPDALQGLVAGIPENTAGLYCFEAQFERYECQGELSVAETFIKAWTTSKEEHKKASPNVNKDRIRRKLSQGRDTWHTLYLGKSENIRTRVGEHIFGMEESGWSCLRLALLC